jgi:predicted nucleic acid-binding protein
MILKILPDTHVLIRGLLNPNSYDRRVLSIAHTHGEIFISHEIKKEVLMILKRKEKRENIKYVDNFYNNLKSLKYTPLTTKTQKHSGINKKDYHTVSPVIEDKNLCLITNDIKLLIECKEAGINAIQPWQFISKFDQHNKTTSIHNFIMTSRILSSDCVSVFARFEPGAWAEKKINQKFTICEIKNLIWIYYDADISKMYAQLNDDLRLELELKLKEHQEVCVYININNADKSSQIIFIASVNGQIYNHKGKNQFNKVYISNNYSSIIGQTFTHEHNIWSWLKGISIGGYKVAPQQFKKIVALDNAMPVLIDDNL